MILNIPLCSVRGVYILAIERITPCSPLVAVQRNIILLACFTNLSLCSGRGVYIQPCLAPWFVAVRNSLAEI
jgi:hypothetical protein